MTNLTKFDVVTPQGPGILKGIYLTELGLVMGKVYLPEIGLTINYQLSSIGKLLKLGSHVKNKKSQKKIQSV